MAPPRRRKANISRPSRPSAPPGRTPTSGAAQTRANISRARTSKADIARDLDAARGRKEFFSNRPDVSDDRAARRMTQADELQRFKNLYTKPVYTDTGSRVTGVTQMKLDAPRTLEQERQRLVQQYGPTTREVMGDIGYGLGSLARGVGQAAQQYLGSGGLFGLAVNAFKDLSNTVDQKRQQLGEKISALTDVQKEKIANPSRHKLSILKDPELQDISLTEKEQMTAKQQADLIKQNLDRVSTPVASSVTDDSFRGLPGTGYQAGAPRVFDNRFVRMPGSGYQAGAGLPTLVNQDENYIGIQNGKAIPISKEEFLEDQRIVEENFANDPFFADKMTKTSNQMNIAPGFEIVSDYQSPEARMQELINQNQVNNTNMFNSGINNAKNQLSELERVFGVDMR